MVEPSDTIDERDPTGPVDETPSIDPSSTTVFPRGHSAPPPPPPPPSDELKQNVFLTLAAHLRSGDFRSVELPIGSRVHHYEIVGVLGRGGMSRVFDARHVYLGQEVALKTTLDQPTNGDTEFADRFLREAKALALLPHPNVIRVLDANVWQGIPYVITERLRGRSLADELHAIGTLSISRTLDFLEEISSVLEQQESVGIVHRDIKPGNVQVREDGSYCLYDYGLVGFGSSEGGRLEVSATDEVTKAGQLLGTPRYMAPEQISGAAVGPWTDLYCLGATAWHALAGHPARSGSDMGKLAMQAFERPPAIRSVRADVSEELDQLLAHMMAPAREERYASVSELRRDLFDLRYRGRRVQGSPRGRAFVAMPFARRFGTVWEAIEDACIDARLRPSRVDRVVYVENIWAQIVQEIIGSSVVIADFTAGFLSGSPNVNVATEASHAVALKKPVIVITQSSPQKLPFDWRHVPVLRYQRTRAGLAELRRGLAERLQQVGRSSQPR